VCEPLAGARRRFADLRRGLLRQRRAADRRDRGAAQPELRRRSRRPGSNSEHPQFVKLVIAGAIKLFGDGPFAWRIGSVLFGIARDPRDVRVARAGGASRWCSLLARR